MSNILDSHPDILGTKPNEESPKEREERKKSLLEASGRRMWAELAPFLRGIRIPLRFKRLPPLDKLSWKSDSGRRAAEYCMAFACGPQSKKPPLLMGRTGTGKSALLYKTAEFIAWDMDGIARNEIERRLQAIGECIDKALDYCEHEKDIAKHPRLMQLDTTSGSEIAHQIRATVERRNLDETVERFRQSESAGQAILFIDDIEVMKMSDWLHEELYRIFDYRYMEEMPTPMATNLTPDELTRHLGDRLVRRIIEMTEPFVIE